MANPIFNINTSGRSETPGSPPIGAAAGVPDGTPPPEQPGAAVGVITTPQSAITFAGAPAIVITISKVLGPILPNMGKPEILPIILSIAIGMLIYWASAPVNGETREKVTGFGFALINSIAIAAAALGISTASAG